jgi:hypothetical protein
MAASATGSRSSLRRVPRDQAPAATIAGSLTIREASAPNPCLATLATLQAELGKRAAAGISIATVALALGVGVVPARLLGIA